MNVFLVLCIVTRRNDLVDENLTADVDDGRRRDLIIVHLPCVRRVIEFVGGVIISNFVAHLR